MNHEPKPLSRHPGSGRSHDRSPELRIELLGRFDVSVNGQPIEPAKWRLTKASALVKILALHPQHRMSREELIELLWPESPVATGVNNFHRTLHAARRALDVGHEIGPSPFLRLARGTLELYPEGYVWTDVKVFEDAAKRATEHGSIKSYGSLSQLYSGDLLPDDMYEDWAMVHREELRETFRSALVHLGHLYRERCDHDRAIENLRRAIELEPTDEDVQTLLMRQYALAGMRQQAIRQFQSLRQSLRHSFDTEPALETQSLYEAILSGRYPEASPPCEDITRSLSISAARATEPGHPHNLPVSLTSFIGRERELEDLSELVSRHRLVTVTGTGGIGKTRLALELGSRSLSTCDHGVWLVELASITDPLLVDRAIANCLDVQESPAELLLDSITTLLANDDNLLILDNCEHVVERSAEVTNRLLRYCPRLRILATSREPLRVPGEVVWQLPPLAVPPSEGQNPESAPESEAVQLFVERAQVVQRGFSVAEGDVPHLVEICKQLDGIPLAIELAAARISILSPKQLASRLNDVLPLLSESPRTVPSRQQTMEAAIDWSYSRLTPSERWLFRQLAVFVGGYPAEAVEAVVDPDRIGSDESWISLLKQLVDKSFISIEESDREFRYRIPEPMRQYGLRRLDRHDELQASKVRHCIWCLQLAEDVSRALDRSITPEDMKPLDHELSNLRAALSWGIEQTAGSDCGLRLAAALWRYWEVRGLTKEGRFWLDRLLGQDSGNVSPDLRANALRAAGNLARNQGDFTAAIGYHQHSLRLRRQLNDRHGTALALNNLGAVHRDMGDFDRTVELCTESLEMFREVGDEQSAGISLFNLGYATRQLGELEEAENYFLECLHIFRRLGDHRHIASALNHLAQIALQHREIDRARMYAEESMLLNRSVDDAWGIALTSMTLGRVFDAEHDEDLAAQSYVESLELLQRLEVKQHIAECLIRLAGVFHRLKNPSAAIRLLGAAQSIHETIGIEVLSSDRAEYDLLIASLKEELDDRKFSAAWAAGWAMTQDRAVEFALSTFTHSLERDS